MCDNGACWERVSSVGSRFARSPPADRIHNIGNAEGKVIMTATTTTSSRNASKRRTGQPRTVPPTVVDVCTSGLPLDEDIADVVQRVGKFDAIESGHADALRTLTERTDHALSEYVRLARAWKAARRPLGAFPNAIGSGDKNTHRRLMLAGELWDAYETVPDVKVSLYRCLQWVNVSSATDIARDIASIRDSVSDTVGLSHDLPIRQVKATRKARTNDGTSSTGEGTGEGSGEGSGTGSGEGSGTGEGSAPPVVIPSRVSTSDPVALVTTARAMVESGKVADLDAFAGAVQALVNAVQSAMAERDAMADMEDAS